MTTGESTPERDQRRAEDERRINQRRILVVDDDADFGRFVVAALEHRLTPPAELVSVTSAEQAVALLSTQQWSLLVTDLNLPGASGFDLIGAARMHRRRLPVIVTTGSASLDRAVAAMRLGALDFLVKPVPTADLVDAVRRGLESVEARRDRVLAVGAHPEDVCIGSGGTLVEHVTSGDQVVMLTLYPRPDGAPLAPEQDGEADPPQRRAAEVIGARLLTADPGGPAVDEVVRDVVTRLHPTVVYVHSVHDGDRDHREVHRATVAAAAGVGRLLCYESASATADFQPTKFITIDGSVDDKMRSLEAFAEPGEGHRADQVLANARRWGQFGNGRYAEAFELVHDRSQRHESLRRGRSGLVI